MARVFLSHAGPDKPAVRRIAAALRAAGHDTWLDEDNILVGESIPIAVERGLRDADFVVLCLSKAAAERGWVEAECDATLMQQFRERKERVLPVRLEDVTPPGLIMPLAHVDLFPDEQAFNGGIDRLARSIAEYTARRAVKGEASVAGVRPTSDTEPPLSQHRRSRPVPERFQVALSFSGAEREFVRAVAEALERRLGPSSVFFDEWYEFYIAGHDADVKLQRIYATGCELAVVCVSKTYGSKAWTRAEHEAIRSRHMQARAEEDPRQRDRIFPIRVGDGDVDGIPFNAIVPEMRGRTPEQVAEFIVDRLQFVMGSTGSAALPSVGSPDASVALMGRFPADEQGRAAVSLEGLHDSDRPQFLGPPGVDAGSSHQDQCSHYQHYEVRGPIVLESSYYVRRIADELIESSVKAPRSFPYVLEPRRTGKSSLVVRALAFAKRHGTRAIYVDLDTIGQAELEKPSSFIRNLAEIVANETSVPSALVNRIFSIRVPNGRKLTAVLDEILRLRDERILVAFDHIEALLHFAWYADFFRLVRAWHNKGSGSAAWAERFNVLLAGSGEPDMFISGLNDSPFNVGKRIRLADFTIDEITTLANAYRVSADRPAIEAINDLIGGHPEQTHRLLVNVANAGKSCLDMMADGTAVHLFEDDLRRVRKTLDESPELRAFLQGLNDHGAKLNQKPAITLYRMGVLRREGARGFWRSRLYRDYLLGERV